MQIAKSDDLLRRLDEIGSPLGTPCGNSESPALTPYRPSLSSDSFSSVEFAP